MIVEYTQNTVRGEPGPNIYWKGGVDEYRLLLNGLHSFGRLVGQRVVVSDLSYVRVVGIRSYEMLSTSNGGIISKIDGGKISTDLTCECWREFLHKVLSISFGSGFVYQEFDGKGLLEEANIIMESKG
jgi:hypothetical protein